MDDDCLQFLNEEEDFVHEVGKLINKWELKDWWVNYNIVAVCGQPGSGKSTY
ncbi:hypothetical protein THASP1DRAFT_33883 [Thamnocephalis sphaerospora]|uniref:Uncharacterized protein n=1 Tax=Thamnocephalis sphaerospora TaxID=78915 RepID=A0A4P9XFJ1_9FUNG|nr:hypothetical protein THASP1DRAFT_33883 [Thamnocephalis sphaerospora]|eukprot:RKP04363.1 hypothetical protein THASP1DRAFT_33883 [Thamnocephalis sphaerospora]